MIGTDAGTVLKYRPFYCQKIILLNIKQIFKKIKKKFLKK
jgi:hypothetical protein